MKLHFMENGRRYKEQREAKRQELKVLHWKKAEALLDRQFFPTKEATLRSVSSDKAVQFLLQDDWGCSDCYTAQARSNILEEVIAGYSYSLNRFAGWLVRTASQISFMGIAIAGAAGLFCGVSTRSTVGILLGMAWGMIVFSPPFILLGGLPLLIEDRYKKKAIAAFRKELEAGGG